MTFTVCHGKSTMLLRTVNHLFRLGPSIPWRTVSHNQRVTILWVPQKPHTVPPKPMFSWDGWDDLPFFYPKIPMKILVLSILFILFSWIVILLQSQYPKKNIVPPIWWLTTILGYNHHYSPLPTILNHSITNKSDINPINHCCKYHKP